MLTRYSFAVFPALLVTLVLTSHAPAVSAGTDTVYACASRYFGFMRLVKHPRKCRRRERLVTFSGTSGNSGGGDQQARIDELAAKNNALNAQVDALKGTTAALEDKVQALELSNQALELSNEALSVDVAGLKDANTLLQAELQQASGGTNTNLPKKLACISDQSTATDLVFEGCNVRILNGLGATDSLDGTGRGNLIIGYDEDGAGDNDRSGSHNLVIGAEHTYSGTGGLVAGYRNSVTGSSAAVTGGSYNTASGPKSSVSGGFSNVAGSEYASISGGAANQVSGNTGSVSGGHDNQAVGNRSSVSGGAGNQAFGDDSSIGGGLNNVALGRGSSVSGGTENQAWGDYSSVLGGRNVMAPNPNDAVP